MRKGVIILFSLLVLFGLNLILYGFNEDYRFFVKKLKYSGEVIDIANNDNITDQIEGFLPVIDLEPEIISGDQVDFQVGDDSIGQGILEKQELELGEQERILLSKFFSYDLERVLIRQSLFDFTSEYPDDYFEYIGLDGDMTLYLFPTREYDQIQEVFDVISYDLPFEINSVNNFGEASFYINVDEEFNDDFIRMVIKSINGVFGLKIKKDLYNDTKEILKNI